MTTPFVASWIGRARTTALLSPSLPVRAGSWASWAMTNVETFSGRDDRTYLALRLPGKFYDPSGNGPSVCPHLEVPDRTLVSPDPDFPERLALMGNGLLFGWWVPFEVTAAKRALFAHPGGRIDGVAKMLEAQRPALVAAVRELNSALMPQWAVIESLLIDSPDGMSAVATGNAYAEELSSLFPAGAGFHLELIFETKLRERSGVWASRRVGVWQLVGVDETGERFALGVLTPRLTSSSLFKDSLFEPQDDSTAALLARFVVLSRLAQTCLHTAPAAVETISETPEVAANHIRAVPARNGQKYPVASLRSCVGFLQSFSEPESAWAALAAWAHKGGYMLTVTQEGFTAAWRRASRFCRRAEEPDRDDLNVIMPLVWADNRVFRATFTVKDAAATKS